MKKIGFEILLYNKKLHITVFDFDRNMTIDLLIAAPYLVLLLWLVQRVRFYKLEGIDRKWILGAFLLKIAAGVVLWGIYTFYYTDRATADIYKYFDDSAVMFNAIKTHPGDYFRMLFCLDGNDIYFSKYYNQMQNWYLTYDSGFFNDARTIIRLNAFMRLISFGSYHVHMLLMCLLSFSGLVFLYKSFVRFVPNKNKLLFIIIFCLPSTLLWTSGVLKESILFFGMGLFCYHTFKIVYEKATIKSIMLKAIGAFIMVFAKFYLLLALIPGTLFLMLLSRQKNKRVVPTFILAIIICAIPVVLLTHPASEKNPLNLIVYKQNNFVNLARGGTYLLSEEKYIFIPFEDENKLIFVADSLCKIKSGTTYMYWDAKISADTLFATAGELDTTTYYVYEKHEPAKSKIDIPPLSANWTSFLKAAPVGLMNVFLLPNIFKIRSVMEIIPALENLAVLFFIGLSLIFLDTKNKNLDIVLFCLTTVVVLYIIIGITTPVVGAIVRYKIPGMVLLLVCMVHVMDGKKIITKIPFIKKRQA